MGHEIERKSVTLCGSRVLSEILQEVPDAKYLGISVDMSDWGSTWGMKFNTKKCNIMRVSRSRKPLQHFYSLGNEILQEVSDAKYLGIQIDNKLDWDKHISAIAARGQSKLAFLNRNLKGCPKS